MIGNRVRVTRTDDSVNAARLEGRLLKLDQTGALIHDDRGLNDTRIFVPMLRIIEIIDLGRAPGF